MQTKIMEKRGKSAFENCQNIIALKNNIGQDLLRLASLLVVNHNENYYKILGYDTWEGFLAIPEISMSRVWAYKLIKVYETWVEKFGVEPAKLDIDLEKLFLTIKKATKENYKEVLEQARNLSRSDVKQLMSGKEYEFERYKIVICPHCGGEVRVVL